ncbi:MAG: hypothetical protein LBI18_15665 [Planctomycetaceae bacterium]|nr:hypothetical protein [Planctomycetaceae bacterium]
MQKFADIFKKTCFTAGTQIVVGANYNSEGTGVEYVTVNIEDIKVGDVFLGANGEISCLINKNRDSRLELANGW